MQRVASAIGFRNPPPDVLKCGDANMLYTVSVTQCSGAWKDLQVHLLMVGLSLAPTAAPASEHGLRSSAI